MLMTEKMLLPPGMKMATERVTYFFVYIRFFALVCTYTPIFRKYFYGKRKDLFSPIVEKILHSRKNAKKNVIITASRFTAETEKESVLGFWETYLKATQ